MSLRNALNKPIIERRRTPTTLSSTRIKSGATTLIDLLAPDGVDRRWNHMVQVGDSYITTLELRGFPPSLELAWLISEVEQRYHVTLQLGDADLAAMRTIPDAAATLRHLLGQT